jgi:hypothetical protein
MKKILNSGLALILLAVASLSAHAQSNLLYITDTSDNFGTVNLNTDTVTYLGNSGMELRDIGFTNNGSLYGISLTNLWTVSTTSGKTSSVGSLGGAGQGAMVALTNDGNNLVAGSVLTNQIYAVDVSPLKTTAFSGTLTGDTSGGLTFGANGDLYDILTNGILDQVKISGNSIVSTAIGQTGNMHITGMATEANGTVLAIAGTEIYVVNTTTAALLPLFNYAGHGLTTDTGAAIAPGGLVVVPEPGNVALLVLGLGGLLFYQKRRTSSNLS